MKPTIVYQDDARRVDVRARADRNGLDYLEVSPDQLTLTVYFLGKAPAALLIRQNEDPVAYKKRLRQSVIIKGGERVRGIRTVDVEVRQARDSKTRQVRAERDDFMLVRVDRHGDFSTYTLRLVGVEGIDPFYDHIDFTFKAGCVSELDCLPGAVCPPTLEEPPEINYLAKDYASFRQLLLDRLSLTLPDWKERHVPDLGVTLMELLAYTGDYLSYYQDAAATEAYLDTARQRISVRRHARLVDYRMHEGCNARAWLCLETDTDLKGDQALDTQNIYFITGLNETLSNGSAVLDSIDLVNIPPSSYEVFEAVIQQPIELYTTHNRITFYTWGNRQTCLPKGATSATLRDPRPLPPEPAPEPVRAPVSKRARRAAAQQAAKQVEQSKPYQEEEPETPPEQPENGQPDTGLHLQPGDVLIFEEVIGPVTGAAEDANPLNRHAVRLTRITPDLDTLYDPPVPVLEVEWAAEDALPFPLCISAISGPANQCRYIEDISVARGNVILVDHGQTGPGEDLGEVPCEAQQSECDCEGRAADTAFLPARYRPRLARTPITFRTPYPQPAMVARQQALALAALMERVRARVVGLWQQTARGSPLTAEEVEEINLLFGSQAMIEATSLVPEGKEWPAVPPAEQSVVLNYLLAHEDRLLQSKARRVSILLSRAQAGYPQSQVAAEISELFGPQYARDLSPTAAYALGPASLALTQDPRQALPQVALYSTPAAPAAGCTDAGPLFSPAHLQDPTPPIPALRNPQNFAGQVLRSRLSKETQRLLDLPDEGGSTTAELFNALVKDLSALLEPWWPRFDLLDSRPTDPHYVAEINNEGLAVLRFGDGQQGRQPDAGAAFFARYRVGCGTAGNVGAESITQLVTRKGSLSGAAIRARNPMPAAGGIDPEPEAEVKLFAPGAFRKQLMRAITPADYSQLASREFPARLQHSAAALAWTGSWYEAQLVIDPFSGQDDGTALQEEIRRRIEPYRRIGHDLAVLPARYVPLDIELEVCVLPHYMRGHIEAELRDIFSPRQMPNGKYGLFHPDNLTFGSGIYVSKLIAAAQSVTGVESVQVKKLQRLDEGDRGELREGVLKLGPLEIARLDNDPSFPENGRLVLNLGGGR